MDEQEVILPKQTLNIFMYQTQYDSNCILLKKGMNMSSFLRRSQAPPARLGLFHSPVLTAPFTGQVCQGTEKNQLFSCHLNFAAGVAVLQYWVSAEDD